MKMLQRKLLCFSLVIMWFATPVTSFAQADTTFQVDPRMMEMILQRVWTPVLYADFTVEWPSDWVLDTSGQYNTRLMMHSYMENPLDSFSENFLIIVLENVNKYKDIYACMEREMTKIKSANESYRQVESVFSMQSRIPWHKHIYTYTSQGREQLQEQYTFLSGNNIYILNLTIEKRKWWFYKYVGQHIMDSFVLN